MIIPKHDSYRVCGFATHEGELLLAGDGDRAKGRLVLALRALAELPPSEPDEAKLGSALIDVGSAYEGVSDLANAELYYARALALPAYRASPSFLHWLPNLSLGALWRGDFARAETLFREQLERVRGASGSESDVVSALKGLGEALLGLGRAGEAVPLLEDGLALLLASSQPWQGPCGHQIAILRMLGRAFAAVGDTAAALRHIDEAEAKSAGRWDTTRERLDILVTSAAIRRSAGRLDEARERARAAIAWYDAHVVAWRERGESVEKLERERAELVAVWGL
jgi:tetratricopeptide (TPR) repeat protein